MKNSILVKMLDRLFAGLASGPNLNCRPHSSRQRLDWTQFARLQDVTPDDALRQLLSDKQAVKIQARVEPPPKIDKPLEPKKRSGSRKVNDAKRADSGESASVQELTPEEQKQRDDWSSQQSLLTKLRGLAEDAREYEQDTGVHVLHVGFPLLSLPPGASGAMKSSSGGTKRLLAPIAFVPVSLQLQAGPHPTVLVEGLHDGADFLVPNEALFAWLERQTGRPVLSELGLNSFLPQTNVDASTSESELEFLGSANVEQTTEEESNAISPGTFLDPWKELNELVRRVAEALGLAPCEFSPENFGKLSSAPRTDDENPRAEIVAAAVIGLFPMNKQGLLRDMQAMVDDPSLKGPVQSFLNIDVELDASQEPSDPSHALMPPYVQARVDTERLITLADPCQTRAVQLARVSEGLVVHGPPGTGKSQTITNIIGDHLARGQRVLLVCDKRTALDVVARRLQYLGLGSFCSLIHDPQHDQRNLYKQVRGQLEALTSTKVSARAQFQLQAMDLRLQKSFDRLIEAWSMVMERDEQRGVSFHERMGEWLEAMSTDLPPGTTDNSTTSDSETSPLKVSPSPGRTRRRKREKRIETNQIMESVTVAQFEAHLDDVDEIVSRAIPIQYSEQPWRRCAGIALTAYLSRSESQIRDDMNAIADCARALDETCDASIPAFDIAGESKPLSQKSDDSIAKTDFSTQGATRMQLATRIEVCINEIGLPLRKRWSKASKLSLKRARDQLSQLESAVTLARCQVLETEFLMVVRERKSSTPVVATAIADLATYLDSCRSWYGWLAFGTRAKATDILRPFGLTVNSSNAVRLRTFLVGISTRIAMGQLLSEFSMEKDRNPTSLAEEQIFVEWDQLRSLLDLLHDLFERPEISALRDQVCRTLTDVESNFAEKLQASAHRAELLEDLQAELIASGLFQAEWSRNLLDRASGGEPVANELGRLESGIDSLIDVLRIQDALLRLPPGLRALTEQTLVHAKSKDAAIKAIRFRIYANDIAEWLKGNPKLQAMDGARLNEIIREVRAMQEQKQLLVRDLILETWIGRQRQRLLASTGSRLNSLGADLRRRLTTRGDRAMRLRQVISLGAAIEGGDPLFDLCPIWMASPETVAQIFPREPLFDVVIFDEASQCRLEEALPVLTRARRVVIAGDTKQLPPSRFFESAVVTSENLTVETEQDLFEVHQSEIEDLLTAALSLNIQESYLDVHYRSRNADLVEFSNEQFYASRLQAIPGHPKNRVRFPPITLYSVNGVYEERSNIEEADQVCRIIAGLLRRAEPPSIGVACFNLTQRDLILEKLDERSTEDSDFSRQLVAARTRVGQGTFEGLFVKNLENVQGDERDHMIISTTYGLDKEGRFFKRFGPLGQAGGGRRLNVLITRAREEVHLVTSIPAPLYRNLPSIPAGQQPSGGWLLFAYLAYAERLAEDYRLWRDSDSETTSRTIRVIERSSSAPSRFSREVARLVASRHRIGSDVHWGNEGFCVDVAFHHPSRSEDRTLGLLCDGTRFQYADNPVEWDLFRTGILELNGWQIARCWSPEFFRDPEGSIRKFAELATRVADESSDPEGIPVQSD